MHLLIPTAQLLIPHAGPPVIAVLLLLPLILRLIKLLNLQLLLCLHIHLLSYNQHLLLCPDTQMLPNKYRRVDIQASAKSGFQAL